MKKIVLGLLFFSQASMHAFNTELFNAAARGDKEMVEALLLMGDDVEGSSVTGTTPLVAAIAMCHPDVVKVLVLAGAQVTKSAKLANWANMHGAGGCSKIPDSKMIDCLIQAAQRKQNRQ